MSAPSIVKNIEDSYPLSPIQEGMLFHSLYAPQSGVDVEQIICALHEDLNISALKRSWQRVVERHQVLRTSFCWSGVNEPIQEVHRHVTLPWFEQDWRGESAAQQEKRLEAYLQADRRRGFELTEAPLMRLALFRVESADYQLIWTFHHALLDGRSFPLVLKELFAFYEAFCRAQELQLELPHPYRDYIDWLKKQDFIKAQRFWRQTLKGFSAPTPLVFDRAYPSKSDQSQGYGKQEIRLPETLTKALQSMAQQHQLTLNTLVQGAWALLLSRYSGDQDVVFGATRACRRSALKSADSMVGLFINTLPVRVGVSAERLLLPWLKDLRAAWLAIRDYEHTPLVKVQGWSDIPSGKPLFESILVFENYLLNSTLRSLGKSWENREFRLLEQTNYPLAVGAYVESELLLQIAYAQCRFNDTTIARMLGHLRTLLKSMVANPEQRLSDLPLLSEAERHQLMVEWNDTKANYPKDACIHHLFEAQVERNPDVVAVVFDTQQLTYRELNRRANQLAHHLRQLGVGPDVLVGICVERSLEMVVGLLGILKAGGAYLPLDPEYPKSRLAFMLHDTQAPILLTQSRLYECLPQSVAKVVCLDTDWKQISLLCDRNPVKLAKPTHLAYVIYTSGSTGQAKGVMIPHRSICNHLLWMQTAFQLTEVDRVLQKTSLSFDVSTFEVFWPLLAGLRMIVAKPGGHQDSAYLVKLIAKQKITFLHAVPSLLQVLLESEELETCNCLRYVTCGGEALPNELKERFFDRLDAQLYNAYGPTEAAVGVIYGQCQSGSNQPIVPIGRPIAHTQIYLLDSDQKPQPIGVPGELHIGGVGLARGYLNRLELTAERFIPNPFSSDPGARLYKTGDNARYLADGKIEYIGRIDHQVKLRGFRIELGEIEAVLSQHPTVLQTAVIVREDVPGDKRLVAYVVPNQSHAGVPPRSPTGVDLRRFLKEQLPEYMIPNAFVMLDTLPLTPNGKVDRRFLPVPDTSDKSLEAGFVPPRTPTEEVLAGIWAEVLRVEVGIHDNFFELGGHSLLATQIISRVRQTFNVELPLRTLFEAATVADLGSSIGTVRSATPESQATKEPLTPRQAEILTFVHNARETEAGTYQSPWWGKDNEYPISPELELYWVSSQLTSGNIFSPKYSIQTRSIWECEFDPVLFQRACDLVVERNEILRTRLIRKGSWVLQLLSGLLPTPSINTGSLSRLKRLEQATIALLEKPHSVRARLLHRFMSLKIQLSLALVRQKVLPPQPVQWTNHNCEPVSDHIELQRLVEEIANTEAECPFDLEMGPLFRSCAIKNWNNTHTVIVTAHHGFVDFIGIHQVMDELRTVYQALLRNELDSLAVRPQYRNYATRLASLKNSTSYKADIEFWQKHFANCNPTVVPPQPSTYHREDFYINEPVEQETAALIHSYCQQKRLPASAFFLAGYYLFLYRITRQSHLYTLVNNGARPDLESEATIGMFLQLFPLVVNLTQTPTIADLIQASAQNIFALLDHTRVSLPCLVSHDIRIAAAMMKQPVGVFQVIQTTHKPKGQRRVPRYGIDASEWRFTIGINVPSHYNVNIAYNTASYKHEYVENLVDEYQQILAIMAINPQGPVLNFWQTSQTGFLG